MPSTAGSLASVAVPCSLPYLRALRLFSEEGPFNDGDTSRSDRFYGIVTIYIMHLGGLGQGVWEVPCDDGTGSIENCGRPADHGPHGRNILVDDDGPGGILFPMTADGWAEVVGYHVDGCIKVDVYQIDRRVLDG
ncbi:hypothetical protein BDR07DRAFT_1372204 [Suillus spraguei]|nr:hypothetical protein BDR07DRAFT_1372204 [Suillus spraguei]